MDHFGFYEIHILSCIQSGICLEDPNLQYLFRSGFEFSYPAFLINSDWDQSQNPTLKLLQIAKCR